MQRYYFEIAYNGSTYAGWQRQPKDKSVQEAIEVCLSKLNSNQALSIVGCGRTDTGVHAHHYIFHVDLPETFPTTDLVYKLNKMLPESIAIFDCYPVSTDQHARFSATARTYRYFIHQSKNPFKENLSWYYPTPLNFEAMNEAGLLLLGTQDFTSFSKLHTDVHTNICSVTKAEWVQVNEHEAYFEITANRFLRNMVRATVGTLIDVGRGALSITDIQRILAAKDRGAASLSVPAHGLFLWKIEY